jgi:ABC-type phosphate transport system permease subunit
VLQKPVTPVVQIPSPKNQEIGPAEVLLGSIALIGGLIVIALLIGLLTGGIFIMLRRLRDRRSGDNDSTPHTRLDLSSH